MSKFGRRRTWYVGAIILTMVLCCVSALAQTVSASTYGRGDYSDCKYQTDCPKHDNNAQAPVPSTPAPVTPSPQIVVVSNLTDNQTITSRTTEIVITHLERINPDGTKTIIPTSDIGWVAFYVENKLVTTQYNPESDGQFHITWDVGAFPGTHIALVFYDHLGNVIQRLDKTVKLAAALAGGPLAASIRSSTHKKVVLTPKEEVVLKSLPYWLLLILLAIALRLWVQSVREIRATDRIRAIMQNERDIYMQKQNFVSLISHYLRTPLTSLQGGIELLSLPSGQPATIALNRAYGTISSKAEEIISKVDAEVSSGVVISSDAAALTRRPAIAMPFWTLISSFVLITILFEALAAYFTSISYGWFDILAEVLIGIAVIIFFLLGVRQSQIKKTEREHQESNLTAQSTLDTSRNHFIIEVAQDLRAALTTLSQACQPFVSNPTGGKFLVHGLDDLTKVIVRLNVAATTGAATAQADDTVVLNDIIEKTLAHNQEQILAKHLHIDTPRTTFSVLSKPALVAFVVESLIENAVTFSNDNGVAEVAVNQDASGTSLTVHDNGPGIAEDKLQKLFEPFSRAADATDFSHEGMGFDLYLCKIIMQRLGGSIHLDSQENQGASATITLPVQQSVA
jgi:signal transduction histidine kinase